MKSRKRKKKKLSPQKREARKKLKNWSLEVKKRADGKCEWCGATKYLNAHHIIGKRFEPLRYEPRNGIALCPKCHKFGIGWAAHENPFHVNIYLTMFRTEDMEWLVEFIAPTIKWMYEKEQKEKKV